MTTNGGAHKFKKNDNNWFHKHSEPQQVDVVVSSIPILGLESLSAFPGTHPLKVVWVCQRSTVFDLCLVGLPGCVCAVEDLQIIMYISIIL